MRERNSLDNSEWMRNGDYTPTRLEAQNDAVNLIFSSKTQSNPENTVGVMTMAGKGYVLQLLNNNVCPAALIGLRNFSPEVLVTLTSDIGKILTALHNTKIGGKANLMTGIQIAQVRSLYNDRVLWTFIFMAEFANKTRLICSSH
jgi:26S proteasome regulatory subunit N10